jgi:hypothetical protein
MNKKSILASALIVLGSTNVQAADDYCTYPLLYAFDIRPACEQFGAEGMRGLMSSNLVVEQLAGDLRVGVAMKVAETATSSPAESAIVVDEAVTLSE